MLNDRLPVLADYHFTPPLLLAGDDGGAEGALPPHTAAPSFHVHHLRNRVE